MSLRMTLQLVPPSERYRDTFLRALREFRDEGLSWWVGGDLEGVDDDFAAFVAKRLAAADRGTETSPSKTHRWARANDELVGRISTHHELTDALRVEGGHVGYDTVPSSFRGRGFATEMLRQALPVARCPLRVRSASGIEVANPEDDEVIRLELVAGVTESEIPSTGNAEPSL